MNIWSLIYALRNLEEACTSQGVEHSVLDRPVFVMLKIDGVIHTGRVVSFGVVPNGVLLDAKELAL